jgi:hypothetical protein
MPEPKAPDKTPMSPRESWLRNAATQGGSAIHPNTAARFLQEADELKLEREQKDATALLDYQRTKEEKTAQKSRLETWHLGAEQRAREAAKHAHDLAQAEWELKQKQQAEGTRERQAGLAPKDAFELVDKDHKQAKTSVQVLRNNQILQDLINQGVIVGWGQQWRISGEAFKAWALRNPDAAKLVSNTEQIKSLSLESLKAAIQSLNPGTSDRASDIDTKIAQTVSGMDPALQRQTIEAMLKRSTVIHAERINDFERRRDVFYPTGQGEKFFPVMIAPPQHVQKLLQNKDNPAVRQEFNNRFGMGTAELFINRALGQ